MRFMFGTSEGEVKEYGLELGDENQQGDERNIELHSESTQEARQDNVEGSTENRVTEPKWATAEAEAAAVKNLKDQKPWGTTFSSVSPPSNPPPEPLPDSHESVPSPSSTPIPPTSLPFSLPSSSVETPSQVDNPPPPQREVQIHVSPSSLNHQAYISRQGYYSSFRVSNKTIMAEDLEQRVPVFGMVDLRMDKEETPIRIRVKRDEAGDREALPRLRELWENGMRKRNGGATAT